MITIELLDKPEITKIKMNCDEVIDNKPPWIKTTGKSHKAKKETNIVKTAIVKKDKITIKDDSNWDAWCERYINPTILNKEYKKVPDYMTCCPGYESIEDTVSHFSKLGSIGTSLLISNCLAVCI